MIDTAILLSAGRGVRLRPLTDSLPKPLLPVNHKPLIVYHIEKLAKAGLKNIIVNTHYLAEKLKASLQNGHQFGVNIIYSDEHEILETGGGILKALTLFKNSNNPFLVISSDIFTDYSFDALIDSTFLKNFNQLQLQAHLILVPNPAYHLKGDFNIDTHPQPALNYLHRIQPHSKTTSYTYASFGVFHQRLFYNCESTHFRLSPLLYRGIDDQKITGEIYFGQWYNVGTMPEYEALCHNIH
jgi:MurNAc alpha-1-phosphate uridylyltransferase